MFYRGHNPPHFHSVYAEHEGLIDIQKLELWSGHLPPRVLGLVIEWAAIRQQELMDNWERARNLETLANVDPLV